MKELQALQRDDDVAYGAMFCDHNEYHHGSMKNHLGGGQGGTPVHAQDLPAPSEHDIEQSRYAEDMSSVLMSSVEDDKLWNPVLKARLGRLRDLRDAESIPFEDDVDFNAQSGNTNVVPPRFRNRDDSR
jgi:hypothetical protein